ncbi:MAG: photosynthetic complex putative assembly protein PuhB [Pseudomonadota bacterium]
MSHQSYIDEPVAGLQEQLPADEEIIWRGFPDRRLLARRVFFVRAVSLYFLALLGVHLFVQWSPGASIAALLTDNAWMAALAGCALLLLLGLAYAYSQTTLYTLTTKRLVLRIGFAIPMVINIPLSTVRAADLRRFSDGSGDIILTLCDGKRMSYIILWPHVAPWKMFSPKPALRCLVRPDLAAAALASVAPASPAPSGGREADAEAPVTGSMGDALAAAR